MVQEFDYPIVDEPFCKDIALVSMTGFVDLRIAYQTGSIPSELEGTESASNGIEDPSSIIGRPDDIFAVHRAAAAYDAVSDGTTSVSMSPNGAEDA